MTLPDLSLQDFADLIGKSRGTVQAWVRRGLPVATPRGCHRGAHVIDPGPAMRWVLQHVEAEAEGRIAALTANPALETARAKKLSAEAQIAELNARKRTGELVEAEAVATRWSR